MTFPFAKLPDPALGGRARVAGIQLLVGSACVLVAMGVAAQERALPTLNWAAPAGCPQLSELRERIRRIAGTAVRRESHLQAEGLVTRDEGRFHLKLVVRDGDLVGERNITSDSCEDLAGAAAVALGLLLRSETRLSEGALDGVDTHDASGPRGAPQPAPASPGKQPAEAQPPHGSSSPSTSRGFHPILLGPALLADWGPLPRPSVGVSLGAGLGYERWRVMLAAQLWLKQSVAGTELPAYGADVGRQTAVLTLGRGFVLGRVELVPSLALALERITARGRGARVSPSEQQALWLGMGAELRGLLHLGHGVALAAGLGARAETSRPVIAIDGLGDVRQLGPLAATSLVGVEWSW